MLADPLTVCPHCQRHVRSSESQCPHCGEPLRDGKGRVVATAGAVLMGLTLGATVTCSPLYGAPPVPDDPFDSDDDSVTGESVTTSGEDDSTNATETGGTTGETAFCTSS